MRPNIPDSLAEQIEQNYERAGYSTKTSFVCAAIRRHLEDIEMERTGDKVTFSERRLGEKDGVFMGKNQFTSDSHEVYADWDKGGFNTLILGYIGSGKTVASITQAYRALKEYEDLRVFIIDPLDGHNQLVKEMNGETYTREDLRLSFFTPIEQTFESYRDRVISHIDEDVSEEEYSILSACLRKSFEEDGMEYSEVLKYFSEIVGHPERVIEEEIDVSKAPAALDLLQELQYESGDRTLEEQTERLIKIETGNIELEDRENPIKDGTALAFLEATRAAQEYEGKSLIICDEGHILSGDWIEHSYSDARLDNIGYQIIVKQLTDWELDLRKMVDASDYIFAFRHELKDGVGHTLGLDSYEKDYIQNAKTGKNANINGAEALLRFRDEGWSPVLRQVQDDEKHVLD